MGRTASDADSTARSPRDRLASICEALPEVSSERVEGERHQIFKVRNRTFAYYIEDHHGDSEIALHCKAAPGLNVALVEHDSHRFYMPPYIGHKGWIAARLAIPGTDWKEITDLVLDSYCLIAPKRLAREATRGQ